MFHNSKEKTIAVIYITISFYSNGSFFWNDKDDDSKHQTKKKKKDKTGACEKEKLGNIFLLKISQTLLSLFCHILLVSTCENEFSFQRDIFYWRIFCFLWQTSGRWMCLDMMRGWANPRSLFIPFRVNKTLSFAQKLRIHWITGWSLYYMVNGRCTECWSYCVFSSAASWELKFVGNHVHIIQIEANVMLRYEKFDQKSIIQVTLVLFTR